MQESRAEETIDACEYLQNVWNHIHMDVVWLYGTYKYVPCIYQDMHVYTCISWYIPRHACIHACIYMHVLVYTKICMYIPCSLGIYHACTLLIIEGTQPIHYKWSITAYNTQAPTVVTVSCIHILTKSVFRVQHALNMVYTSIYTYILCTYSVRTGMYICQYSIILCQHPAHKLLLEHCCIHYPSTVNHFLQSHPSKIIV
jgi:hypothetical protein